MNRERMKLPVLPEAVPHPLRDLVGAGAGQEQIR